MAYTYREDGTSSSTFNKDRGGIGVNKAVGGAINDVWSLAKMAAIPAAGLYLINEASKK